MESVSIFDILSLSAAITVAICFVKVQREFNALKRDITEGNV